MVPDLAISCIWCTLATPQVRARLHAELRFYSRIRPSEDEIRLANEINAAFGENATITGVDFALEKRVTLRAVDGNAVKPSSLNSRRSR
jgi:hypothetical protein